MCCCELNSSGSHPRVVSGPLHALGSPSSLRPLCVLRSLKGQFLDVPPEEQVFSVLSGFPYGTAAQHEDQASTTPEIVSVAWENRNWLGGVLSLFLGAKLSSTLLTFISTNSIKAVELKKSVGSACYLTTQPRPLSPLRQSDLSIFQPRYQYFWIFSI